MQGLVSSVAEVNTGPALELVCSTAVVLGLPPRAANAGSVFELVSSTTVVLGSVSAVGEVPAVLGVTTCQASVDVAVV